MALENGEAGGGDYIPKDWWMERATEGCLVVFRILRIEEPVNLSPTVKEKARPVVVDLVVLNGTEEGTVYRNERVIQGGIVNTLREKTVTDPTTKKKAKVARREGDDVAVRMGTYKSFGSDKAGANPCGPDEFEKVKRVFTDTSGDPYTWFEKKAMASIANAEASDPGDGPDDDLPF
jgi:hypothetical protein